MKTQDEWTTRTAAVRSEMPISEAFEAGLWAREVRMPPGAGGVELADLTLVEDDGSGVSTWYAPHDTVRGPLMVKKIFDVARPRAKAARLVFYAESFDGEKLPLAVSVNGRELECTPNRWTVLEIPADALRRGKNEVVFRCGGVHGYRLPIALREAIVRNDASRKHRPARSLRSTDGGAKWSPRLGDGSAVAGEYMVRLSLEQYAAEGELVGPVIDLAAPSGGSTVSGEIVATGLRLETTATMPQGTSIRYYVRSGANPVNGMRGWSGWTHCDKAGRAHGKFKRFVQWRAVLRTKAPQATPSLSAVSVSAEVSERRPNWSAKLAVGGSHNETIRTTSIPFEYERWSESHLKQLRKMYKLEKVVAGARTELEKMVLLRNWVTRQWTYLPHGLPHPEWDALEILERKSGVCVQYAIVYMQCALALGMQTRFVFGQVPYGRVLGATTGGHEVNEFWSNDHRRWMYMDPREDNTFLDAATNLPASMLEVHEETLRLYFAERPIGLLENQFERKLTSERLRLQTGEAPPQDGPAGVPILWGCLWWMPRNNFFGRRYPQPIAQGRGTWSWTGYWGWTDAKTPRQYQFAHHTSRRSDIDWTLNQVRWSATAGKAEGTVEVTMGTVTPDFDSFLVSVDGGPWRKAGATFAWKVSAGSNRLEMRVRNRGGVLGCVSHLEVERPG